MSTGRMFCRAGRESGYLSAPNWIFIPFLADRRTAFCDGRFEGLKISRTFFKISPTYFKICALYFLFALKRV